MYINRTTKVGRFYSSHVRRIHMMFVFGISFCWYLMVSCVRLNINVAYVASKPKRSIASTMYNDDIYSSSIIKTRFAIMNSQILIIEVFQWRFKTWSIPVIIALAWNLCNSCYHSLNYACLKYDIVTLIQHAQYYLVSVKLLPAASKHPHVYNMNR